MRSGVGFGAAVFAVDDDVDGAVATAGMAGTDKSGPSWIRAVVRNERDRLMGERG